MEHVLVDLAPGRQRSLPALPAEHSGTDEAPRRSRRARRAASAGRRPTRHRQEAVRMRAELREFEWALARLAR